MLYSSVMVLMSNIFLVESTYLSLFQLSNCSLALPTPKGNQTAFKGAPDMLTYLLSKASVVSLSTKNTYFASNNWNKKKAMEIATAGLKSKIKTDRPNSVPS